MAVYRVDVLTDDPGSVFEWIEANVPTPQVVRVVAYDNADEGAANHMRLARAYGEAGVEIFVYGVSGGAFPARQPKAQSP